MRGLIDDDHVATKEPLTEGPDPQRSTYQHFDPSPNPLYDVANVKQPASASNPVYFKNLGLKPTDGNEDCYDTLQRGPTVKNQPHQNVSGNKAGIEYQNLGNNAGSEYSHLGKGADNTGKICVQVQSNHGPP